MILPTDPAAIDVQFNTAREAADDIQALLAAAQVLRRRWLKAVVQA
jgi:hypothetical protein